MYHEENYLPDEHLYDHDFCLYLYDICVSFLEESLENTEIELKLSEEEKQSLIDIESDGTIEWMIANGYETEANLLMKRKIFTSLLMDFLHYTLESLKTSKLGKSSVSFTLLRKPFKDNLFYLEWLIYDSDELLSFVDNGSIHLYELGNMRKNNKEKMKAIINNALDKNPYKNYVNPNDVLEEDYMYKLRYDYSAPFGLELMWNKSIHLVTTGRNIKSKDFNDLFMNEEDLLRRWDYYYSKVPHLSLYVTGIVVCLYEKLFTTLSEEEKILNDVFISSRWLTRTNKQLGKEMLEIILKEGHVSIECETCGEFTDLNLNHVSLFQYEYFLPCNVCGESIPIARYHFK